MFIDFDDVHRILFRAYAADGRIDIGASRFHFVDLGGLDGLQARHVVAVRHLTVNPAVAEFFRTADPFLV